MTTFIKTKFKIPGDQTNIDKYRLAAKYYRISYHIKIILTTNHFTNFCGSESHLRWSTISDKEFPSNFEVKQKIIEIGPETTKLCFN